MQSFTKISLLAIGISLAAGANAASDKLNIYTWAESIDPVLIEKFQTETGINITLDSYTSNEDLLAKLKSGSSDYDVVFPSQHFVKIMVQEGLLKNIDAKNMAAFKLVDEQWKNMWWDQKSEYSIPFVYGTAGYTVNRDKYKGPANSWKEFFEPTGAAIGNIAVFSTPDEIIPAAQLYLGVEFCTEDSAQMKRIFELLKKQKKDVAVYSSDNISSRIASGEVVMHNWWDGDSMRTRKNNNAPIEYAQPKEGLVGWLDSMVVPINSRNVDNAKTFINWMSETDNATIEYNYYAHSSAVKIDQSKALHQAENSPEIFPSAPIKFTQACSPAAQKLVDKVWTQLLQ
ncbi:MAG: spermidine/putrescine ABC transporter periplasmic spermidine/putrescine-binding protein [Osedax symbiont Rs2]|nr:MAG: spermidine/putrescine ABC transporter periplasmic spermidine/putrescine-binding protein [Osedax symbiont Rs1]EPJ53358.1 MAG: spermidine/putrescine ABC transporter periplasmic spermidine/putrescine-binding protein [Osedax symbiont Rs2]